MNRLADFIRARAAETYPEPRSEGHDFITEKVAPLVSAHLAPGASVCDVGCGEGPALEWFKSKGFEAIGTTLNEVDLVTLRAMGFHVLMRDMHNMDFRDGQFGCVWARHVLEHSPIPFYVLTEFARILKPSGILYVEVPAPDTDCQHETNRNHYSVLGLRMWHALITRAGFEILEARNINMTTAAGADVYFSIIAKKP